MSAALGSSFAPQLTSDQKVWNDSSHTLSSSTRIVKAISASSPHEGPGPSTARTPGLLGATRKPKTPQNRTAEELEIIKQTATRFASRLLSDHDALLYPDIDSPFIDAVDVVNRLLPYHIFQQPREDLFGKGKGKSTDNHHEGEIAEIKFALECWKRRKRLRDRFQTVKTKSGKYPSPTAQAYALAQAVLDADRAETAYLNSELRSARSELDRIEREKRVTTMPARPSYYPNPQSQYFRGYPYTYAQPYAVNVHTLSNVTPVHQPATPASTTPAAPLTGGAIPVQLPVSSLPALHALGIVPVPAISLPPGQPQPPAVLRGSSANGTMLSLEINVSLLQSAQMSGLAMVLNSLISRGAVTDTPTANDSSISTLTSTPTVAHQH